MQPQSPNPNYDFILKDAPKPKRSLLPSFGLPRPVQITLAIVAGLIILLTLSALIFGKKGSASQPVVSLAAEAQELTRVSGLVKQSSTDPNTQALAETVSVVLTSQESQLTSYLASNHNKVNPKQLSAKANLNTDAQIKTSVQNNTLSADYPTYLKTGLNSYSSDLSGAYSSASPKLKAILSNDFNSIKTILDSLKS